MTPESIMAIGFQAMRVAFMLAAPPLLASLVTGLLISILQASTQINEMTLTFIPKVIVVALTVMIAGSWMLGTLVDYVRTLFSNLPNMIG